MREVERPSSYVMRTVAEQRLQLSSELERDPLGVRCAALAGVTLAICLAIIAIIFAVQLIGGGR